MILEINSKDGETVQVGSVLGSISETEEKNSIQSIEKIVPKNKKNQNKINIEEEKTIEPKIFTDENKEKEEKEDAPLVLTQEIKKDEKIKSFEKKFFIQKKVFLPNKNFFWSDQKNFFS